MRHTSRSLSAEQWKAYHKKIKLINCNNAFRNRRSLPAISADTKLDERLLRDHQDSNVNGMETV